LQVFKFCESKFNVAKKCQTLRLGTLHYYQNLEFEIPISDPTEGKRYFSGSSGSYVVTELSPLTNGKIIDNVGGSVIHVGGEVKISIDEDNCYIFSCSINKINHGFLSQYNSCYLVKNVDQVAKGLTQMLAEQLLPNDFEDMESAFKKKIYIECVHKKIDYLDKDTFKSNPENLSSVKLNNEECDICFTKPESYNGRNYHLEKEYRFCFFAFDEQGNALKIKKTPKICVFQEQ